MITNLEINKKELDTVQLSELENSQYFKNYLKNRTKEDILNNFDFVMSKIKAKEVENWDSL